jgi:hypothetical protein
MGAPRAAELRSSSLEALFITFDRGCQFATARASAAQPSPAGALLVAWAGQRDAQGGAGAGRFIQDNPDAFAPK